MSATLTTTTTATAVAQGTYAPADLSYSRGKGFPTGKKPNPKLKQYTWEEVAQHNTEKSAWVYIGTQVYDITPWLDRHPGGKDILLLTAGRDISDLFVTYHPFTDKAAEVIAKYHIGEVTTTEFPQFVPDRGFYQECRQRVGEYFRKNKLDYKDPRPGMLRLAGFLLGAALGYTIMAQGDAWSWPVRILGALLFGVCQALPLLHCMHDASHLAIGSTPTWWKWVGRSIFDWYAGGWLYSWFNQHTIGHHVYTNVMGADPDLPVKEVGDIRRITPFQSWTGYYAYQHVYLMILYGVLGMKARIQDITDTLVDGTNGAIRVNRPSSLALFTQVFTKCWWAFWRIVVPLYFFQCSLFSFAVTFFVCEMVTGYYLAFNFQVSHVSPAAVWPDIQVPMSDEWAINQMHTSIDYGHGSWLTALFSGALNYQSVHHLFPSVSQYHYPAIAPIVKEVCEKYRVRYNYLPTFAAAFKAHVDYLRDMGAQGKEVHAHLH